jgi:hypothetical protein
MRPWLCALLLLCPLAAQQVTGDAADARGTFFIDGIVYQYAESPECTVVVAAHSVANRKFLAVKIRVYNRGTRSATVKPDDVVVSDALDGRQLMAVSGSELARKMRKPQNMARYAVNGVGGAPTDAPITSDMAGSFLEMMRAMAARNNGNASPSGKSVLYTDTPGALQEDVSGPVECDEVCRLRNREAMGTEPLNQLQRPSSPDVVEQFALLANTVPPHANVFGVLYYPLGKLSEAPPVTPHGKKDRRVKVMVPVMGETFQFELPVE